MTTDSSLNRQAALHYLRTPLGAPWKWDEQGQVVVWTDGSTIVFRQELDEVLRSISPSGLPPFNDLVILLAACRGKFPANPNPPLESQSVSSRGGILHTLRTRQQAEAVTALSCLQHLPSTLIGQTRGKALLAAAVFETIPRYSPMESGVIELGLAERFCHEELNTPPPAAVPLNTVQALFNVSVGLRPHTAESLQRRLRTGLDTLPDEAPAVELPSQEQAHRLLAALADHDQLAGLAQVVRDLMAALHLPRLVAQAEDLPTGGASDLGNRGTLDRLLISELAHDDLTLATRVALNEALYLRREPPAHRPERGLAVLLDSGLRMWGIPRVLATAAAIALVAGHRSSRDAQLWRAGSNGLVPLNLLTQEGLEDHLAVMETYLQPTSAVWALQRTVADSPEVDVVIVTHRDALADTSFQASLAQARFKRGFLLVAERDGAVELHALPWGLPRPLAKAQIDVARLFPPSAPRRRALPLIDPGAPGDLPAIFRERVFPLLLPVQSKIEHLVQQGEGGFCITTDRRLFRWEKRDLGARQLLTDLPGSRTSWLSTDTKGRTFAVRGRGKDGRVCVLIHSPELETPIITRLPSSPNPFGTWIDQDVMLLAFPNQVTAVSLVNGEVLAETPKPPVCRWLNGRYFQDSHSIVFASWTGSSVRWDSAFPSRHVQPQEVFTAFDRDGIGAWLLTHDGRIISPAGHELLKTGLAVKSVRISPTGNRLALLDIEKNSWHLINLETVSVRPCPTQKLLDFNVQGGVLPPTRTLQNHFSAIAVTADSRIRLCTTKGKWLELFAAPDRLILVQSPADRRPTEIEEKKFITVTGLPSLGCSLKCARWPGGSSAWLDSRGLLHLKSQDQTLREITLALSFQAPIAAWCSDGQRGGPAFFHGADYSMEPAQAAIQHFCRCLC